tara:strand:+ start:2183 stop:2458 length:276 start_codon:yes stop_codon:yes gene_type:complete
MDKTSDCYVADWEIMYKLPNERHEFFYAGNCTESGARYEFEKTIPTQFRGRTLHIVEYRGNPKSYLHFEDESWEEESKWKHPFKSYPDKAA